MYKIKEEYKEIIKRIIKEKYKSQEKIAKQIGVDKTYISQIVNGKDISKLCAYAFVKALSPDIEILDIFDITNN